MEKHTARILDIANITHDVKRFRIEKPEGYTYEPGQATEVAIHKPEMENEGRPFTFTGLNEEDTLEFIIKIYNDHDGITKEFGKLQKGDELLIEDAWGAITYKGPGTFIAGGAGVTPFIAILRDLAKKGQLADNMLIFSNKTKKDIILHDEFSKILGNKFVNVLTQEESKKFEKRRVNKSYLQEKITNFDQPFYVCGPDGFVTDISKVLKELGANPDEVVFEG
ncbi:MAG: flavodoxin reductase [Bacteroidetes bacterium]|jgi:ferredoxin-NADP reductase|nr:flavodoxin reductase [Bacteroidota bacterium]